MAVVLKYKLTGIEALTRSQVIDVMKRALVRAGKFWHENFAYKRFTLLGYSEYGFKPRARYYEKQKGKFFPTNADIPLVDKGDWRQQVMGGSTVARIRATRDTLTIPLNAPHAIRPQQSEEIRTITPSETRQVKEALVSFINEEFDAEVSPSDRAKGFIGGRVKTLSIRTYNPVARQAAV